MKFLTRNIVVLIVLLLAGCSKNRFEISGTFENIPKGEIIYLEEVVLSEIKILDSTKIKNQGNFSFKGKTEDAGFYQIRAYDKIFSLLIEPGEKVSLTGDINKPHDYDIRGSAGSLLIQRLNEKMADTKMQMDSLSAEYKKIIDGENNQSEIDTINSRYLSLIEEQRRFNTVFILNFYDNLASLYALYQKLDNNTYLFNRNRDVQYYKILSDSLSKYYPNSPYVKALQNNTKDFLSQINLKKIENIAEGLKSSLPDIRLPNLKGDTIALSSLKDKKLVLLSFWASWNEASINENLKLKPLYNKYKNRGFEIYQVSLDDDKESWQKAVNFDELPWIGVSDLSYPNSRAALLYNVQTLPTHYLLNKEQSDILGKNLTSRELENKLANQLN